MQPLSNQEIVELRSRIDQIHSLLAGRGDAGARGSASETAGASNGAAQAVLVNQITFNVQVRRLRRKHFGTAQVAGPIWDMMLDLMLAEMHGRTLSASDLATGAEVPLSSGLRMIGWLESMGFARRSTDERDRRRTIVRLTDHGIKSMTGYFEMIGTALRNSGNLVA